MKKPDTLITDLSILFKYNSVWVTCWNRTSPTSFLKNWTVTQLERWIEYKRFYTLKDEHDSGRLKSNAIHAQ